MIRFPLSSTYFEAAWLDMVRCRKEYDIDYEHYCALQSFRSLAFRTVRVNMLWGTAVLYVLILVAVMSMLISEINLLLNICEAAYLLLLFCSPILLGMEIAYYIPIYISYHTPMKVAHYIVPDVAGFISKKFCLYGLGISSWVLDACYTWHVIAYDPIVSPLLYVLLYAGIVYFGWLAIKAFIALDKRIMETKLENEEWINEHP